jgi:hypothetical protein
MRGASQAVANILYHKIYEKLQVFGPDDFESSHRNWVIASLHGPRMGKFIKGLEEIPTIRLPTIFVSMGSAGPNTNKTHSNRHL